MPFAFAGMAVLMDNLWALGHRNDQAVHAKDMGTLVVQKRTPKESVKSEA